MSLKTRPEILCSVGMLRNLQALEPDSDFIARSCCCNHGSPSMILCFPSGAMLKVSISECPLMVIRISACQSTCESNQLFTSFMTRGSCGLVTSPCNSMNLGCIKFPMVPESTMAVILMESAKVIRAVRSLTRWYGVIAETMAVFCGTTFIRDALFQIFSSVGVTGSVGHPSFLTVLV
jgi:hypothetical protein